MARRRHSISSVDRLPDEVKRAIQKARESGATIDQIVQKVDELGHQVSRSAMGRHLKNWAEVAADLRQSRAMARAMGEIIAEDGDSRVDEMTIELLHSVTLRLLTQAANGELVSFSAKELEALGKVMSSTTSARKNSVEWRAKVRREEAERANAAAAAKVEAVGKARGISADAIKAMREAVLGGEA